MKLTRLFGGLALLALALWLGFLATRVLRVSVLPFWVAGPNANVHDTYFLIVGPFSLTGWQIYAAVGALGFAALSLAAMAWSVAFSRNRNAHQ